MEKPQHSGSLCLFSTIEHEGSVYSVQLSHAGFMDTGESERQILVNISRSSVYRIAFSGCKGGGMAYIFCMHHDYSLLD